MPKPTLRKPTTAVRPRTGAPATGAAGPAAGTSTASPAATRALATARAAVPALRREAEALLAVIARCKGQVGAGFYEMGKALTELLDRKLYLAVGLPTFAAMVEQRCGISFSVANKLVAIYRSIPRQAAQQLGPQKAMEWLRLLRTEAGPDATPQDVRRVVEGKPAGEAAAMAELTTRQIAELRRRAQETQAEARRDPGAAEAHRVARVLAQHLRHEGAEDAVVAARYSGGTWRIRVDLGVDAARAVAGGNHR